MADNTPNLRWLLGLPQSATHEQVKKAFNKAALATHPDHGGDPEAMATVSQNLGLTQPTIVC